MKSRGYVWMCMDVYLCVYEKRIHFFHISTPLFLFLLLLLLLFSLSPSIALSFSTPLPLHNYFIPTWIERRFTIHFLPRHVFLYCKFLFSLYYLIFFYFSCSFILLSPCSHSPSPPHPLLFLFTWVAVRFIAYFLVCRLFFYCMYLLLLFLFFLHLSFHLLWCERDLLHNFVSPFASYFVRHVFLPLSSCLCVLLMFISFS